VVAPFKFAEEKMDNRSTFHTELRQRFFPLLRERGFKGSGSSLRRLVEERIDVVGIQGSRYGGSCCINLGVHFTFLPRSWTSDAIDPFKLKDYECEFRTRLHYDSESDHWWAHGNTEQEAVLEVSHLSALFQERGYVFFDRFSLFPGFLGSITPKQIDSGDYSDLCYTQVRSSLVMARIMKRLGNSELRKQFAQVGLRHLGEGYGADLKKALEELATGE
jgi:hypothetical protein